MEKMTMKTRKELRSEEFLKFANTLKENGFDVYIPEGENPTYCHFVKDTKIGYVENSDNGWNFSSSHKPSRSCGTGYSIHREQAEPTVQMASDCFINRPSWASNKDEVKKYASWEDYLKTPTNQILKYVKI